MKDICEATQLSGEEELEVSQKSSPTRPFLDQRRSPSVRPCVRVCVFLPSADRMCVLTIVEFRFIEAFMNGVQCAGFGNGGG